MAWETEALSYEGPREQWLSLFLKHGKEYIVAVYDELHAIKEAATDEVDRILGEL